MVVDGGDALEIAQAIAAKKTPGTGTYGTTTEIVTDIYGISHLISFFRPTGAPITATVTIIAPGGLHDDGGDAIKQAVADYVNDVAIGGGESGSVEWGTPSQRQIRWPGRQLQTGVAGSVRAARCRQSRRLSLLFTEAASMTVADVTLTVT